MDDTAFGRRFSGGGVALGGAPWYTPPAMAIACALCGRGRMKGHNVSHSNIKTRKISRPNLQRVRALVEGTVRKIRVCTRCIRSGRVKKAA
jgi:large subunit ribosomal protein L28